MPTPTDLVTDLPADFEVFGQAVDSDFADLLGGTTGQILSKTSATDLDFTWVSPNPGDITGVTAGTGISGGGTSGDVTITNDMATTITASGDIVVGTGSGTYDNLPIGTTGQILTADTTVSPYKVKWATPAGGGGKVLQVVQASTTTATNNSTTSYADTTLTGTITPTLATSKILVIVNQEAYSERTNTASLGERGINLKLLRGATVIVDYGTPSDGGFNYSRIRVNGSEADRTSLRFIQPITYLDSPATTSATTYKTTFADAYGGTTGLSVVQSGTAPSTITLLEIGA